MSTDEPSLAIAPEVAAGAAVYSKLVLALYDLEVLGFELPVIFGCPSRRILELYDRNVSDRHLDVGVGTGYFLDRCRFPVEQPNVHLMDLNPNCLEKAARRIRRYGPEAHRCNVLEPIPIPLGHFGSIGVTNLLHCLPGSMVEKAVVFRNVEPLLREGGVLFGATVLGRGVDEVGALYRATNRVYNRKAIFSNLEDGASDLEAALAASFPEHTVEVVGALALFTARPARRGRVEDRSGTT
jgi:SAM-dependent methyltransferase